MKTLRLLPTRAAFALLLAAVLPGCMTVRHVWVKDGISQAEAQREHAVCAYNAEVLCGTQYGLTETEAENRNRRWKLLYEQCMKANGYKDQTIEE